MKKIVITSVAVIFVGLLGWRIYLAIAARRPPESRRGRPAVAVELAEVSRRPVREEAVFTGSLFPRSRFEAAPKVAGRLERLLVNIGDEIASGDLIAVLDGEEYAQQVAQARAELDVSRASLADAESSLGLAGRDLERTRELHEQRIASDSELDEAEARHRVAAARVEVARAQIKQRQAALRSAEVRLAYTRISASWEDGEGPRLIGERFVDEGAMLRANDPVVSVVDTSVMLAVVYVIEGDFPAIRTGQPVELTVDAYPGKSFSGRVARRAPVLDEASRQARVEVEVPNPDRLLAPGMFARAAVEFDERTDALTVPRAALVRRNGQEGVFLAAREEMTARFVPVERGIASDGHVEIVSPELAGEVVTLGHHLLEDGGAIAPAGGGRPEGGGRR